MDLLNIFGNIHSVDVLAILTHIDRLIWGPSLLMLLVGTGLYLTYRLRFIQILKLPTALRYVLRRGHKDDGIEGDISSLAALTTALAATIGTGNIVGVATAIQIGGPGALFWMWIAAFFGMATKYSECLLAVKYRTVDENGYMSGGPMYYIRNGLAHKPYSEPLARFFAISGIGVAFFGIGTFPQINAIVDSASFTFHIPVPYTAVIVTTLVALVIIGGIRSIARVAMIIVPFMAVAYVFGCVLVIAMNINSLWPTVILIVRSAFNPTAAAALIWFNK